MGEVLGPAQLALAILLAVTDAATAERCYQKFKWDVLAPIEADRWAVDAEVRRSTSGCRCRRRVRTAGPTCSRGRTSRVRARPRGHRSTRCGSGGRNHDVAFHRGSYPCGS